MAREKEGLSSLLPGRIAILLIPDFTAISLWSLLEPLRIANRYVARPYKWTLVSVDGEPTPDRNGVKVAVDGALADLPGDVGTLLTIADAPPSKRLERAILPKFRKLARAGVSVGGLDTAPILMARAGLLRGRRATAHWEVLAAFREAFHDVDAVDSLFEVDDGRITCAGGAAGMDLALAEIEASFGRKLAERVAEHCMHGAPRPAGHAQRGTAPGRSPGRRIARAIDALERNAPKRTKIGALADEVGISRRQLNRMFASELGVSPARFRRQIRLERARQMLSSSEASVTEAAIAAGFRSRAHFSRCYVEHFGRPPSHDKR